MVENIRIIKVQRIGSHAHTKPDESDRIMAFLLVTALLALFSSLAFGAKLTRDDVGEAVSVDIAAYGTATQSSTVSHSCNAIASKAIDGNTEGVFYPWCSVTHTNYDYQAWWEVDLKANSIVHVGRIYNRVDCCMGRLTNFDVILKDESDKVLKSFHLEGGEEIIYFAPRPRASGVRYVRIQLRGTNYLSLAEVNVFGSNSLASYGDLSRNKPATQSSTVAHGCSPTASKAVDGNTEGVFYPYCSVTHTNNDNQAWWQVDLQGSRTVRQVYIYNRVDCCMGRLANFNVTLKNTVGVPQTTRHFAGGTNTEVYTVLQYEVFADIRYVRVHLLGQGILSLAEVQVIGG